MWRIMAELKKVAVPHGANPLEIAFELASERPIYEDPNWSTYSLFLNFCYYLSDTLRGQDIGLACDRVGALIGCDGKTVWHMRNEAAETGVLTLTKAGTKKRATRFRFNIEAFKALEYTQKRGG